MTEEVWKDVTDYQGLYKVSNLGKIKGRKLLKPFDNTKGYMSVFLSKNGKEKRFYVHRVVATAFVPNPENKPQINHKNGVRNDNRSENLEWCSRSENEQHKYKFLGFIQKRALPVVQISNKKIIAVYPSIRHAARATKCGTKEIARCCRGMYKQVKGFQWEFEKKDN